MGPSPKQQAVFDEQILMDAVKYGKTTGKVRIRVYDPKLLVEIKKRVLRTAPDRDS